MKGVKRIFVTLFAASFLFVAVAAPMNVSKGWAIDGIIPIHIMCTGDGGVCPCPGC